MFKLQYESRHWFPSVLEHFWEAMLQRADKPAGTEEVYLSRAQRSRLELQLQFRQHDLKSNPSKTQQCQQENNQKISEENWCANKLDTREIFFCLTVFGLEFNHLGFIIYVLLYKLDDLRHHEHMKTLRADVQPVVDPPPLTPHTHWPLWTPLPHLSAQSRHHPGWQLVQLQ